MTPREDYILTTQMYQRVAKVPESSAEELGNEWDKMQVERKMRRKNLLAI